MCAVVLGVCWHALVWMLERLKEEQSGNCSRRAQGLMGIRDNSYALAHICTYTRFCRVFRLKGLLIIGEIRCVRHVQTLIVLLWFYAQDNFFPALIALCLCYTRGHNGFLFSLWFSLLFLCLNRRVLHCATRSVIGCAQERCTFKQAGGAQHNYILSTFKIFKIKSELRGPMLIECSNEQNILEM